MAEDFPEAPTNGIYTFSYYYGRNGEVTGTFIKDIEVMDNTETRNPCVYFGELGEDKKEIEFRDLRVQLITTDENLVRSFQKILKLADQSSFGCDPFNYLACNFDSDDSL